MKTAGFVSQHPQIAEQRTQRYRAIVSELRTASSVRALAELKEAAAAIRGSEGELDDAEADIFFTALSSTGYHPSCSDDFARVAKEKLELGIAKVRAESSVTFVPEDDATATQNRRVYVHRYLQAMKNEDAVEKLDAIAKRAAAINQSDQEIDKEEASLLFRALMSTGYDPGLSDDFVRIASERLDLGIAQKQAAEAVTFVANHPQIAMENHNRYAYKYLGALKDAEAVGQMVALAARVAAPSGELDAESAGLLFDALEAGNMAAAIGFPGFFEAAAERLELRLAQRAALA